MKYPLVAYPLFLFFWIGCAPNETPEKQRTQIVDFERIMHSTWREDLPSEGVVKTAGVLSKKWGIGVSDSLELYYYDGTLRQVSKISNGLSNGIHVEFLADGSLYFYMNILNGKSYGVSRSFSSDGELEEISFLMESNLIQTYQGKSLDSLQQTLNRPFMGSHTMTR